MLIALCPKCSFPVWFGQVDNSADDVRCPHCDLVSNVASNTKVDHQEWRSLMVGEDTPLVKAEEIAMARNTLHMNMRAVAEKMDLPTYMAEWRLLVQDDLEDGGSQEVTTIFQEELKCLIERILKRLNEKAEKSVS